MIKVRTLLRRKNSAGTSAVNRSTGGFSGTASDVAREADHAARADWAENADHAAHADSATHATEADHANDAELWDGHRWSNWIDQAVRTFDDVTFNSIVTTLLRSVRFVDGVAGEGFGVGVDGYGEAFATVDRLTVRKAMTVMELLIERIRAVGGQICVSEANGKIKEVADGGDCWNITFEQETHGFMVGDLIRCARVEDGRWVGYWAEVQSVDGDSVRVLKADCDSDPQSGDECVLMGNTTDTSRQNLILISATHDGQPRVDVYNGVHATSFSGCLRARLGNLDGISDSTFPADNQPHGDGLYSDNAYLRGTFLLSTGEDIKTRFEIVEGRIQSAIEAVRSELLPEGYLSNQDFAGGESPWILPAPTRLLRTKAGKWMLSLGKLLGKSVDRAAYVDSDGLHITDGTIYQREDDMRSHPAETTKITLAVTITPITTGTLTATLGEITVSRKLQGTGTATRIAEGGEWDGKGDFSLTYTGEAVVHSVVATEDAAAALAWRYSTLFEQSDKLIRLAAQNFDAEGRVLAESSIAQTAQEIAMEVKTEIDGGLRRTGINITDGVIEASADSFHFTDTEGNTQMLIEGGKINADAVDVNRVIVRDSDNPLKRVEITPEGGDIKIYDQSGAQCQQFTGDSVGDLSLIFGEGGGGHALSFTAPTGTQTATKLTATTTTYTPISESWQAAAGDVRMLTGELTVEAHCADIERDYSDADRVPVALDGATITAAVVLQCFSDSTMHNKTGEWVIASATATQNATRGLSIAPLSTTATFTGGTTTSTKDLTGLTVRATTGGYYRLAIRRAATVAQTTASAKVTWGQQSPLSARFNSEAYASTYFANGFALGTKSDNYVAVWNGDNGMNLEARNGDSGLRMNNGSVSRLVKSMWMPVPAVLANLRVLYNTSAGTYSVSGYTANNILPTASRTSTGRITIALPASWRTALGEYLTANRMIVTATPMGTCQNVAVTSFSAAQIVLTIDYAGGSVDGDFALTIQIL